jgi:hypothetical protein
MDMFEELSLRIRNRALRILRSSVSESAPVGSTAHSRGFPAGGSAHT